MKIYISDGTADGYQFGYRSVNIEQLGNHHYKFTPVDQDFSDVPFIENITTLTVAHSRCLVLSKTNMSIEVISANELPTRETWFDIKISKGHALTCRSHLLNELGDTPVEIYVGPISFNSSLIEICKYHDIDIG